MPPTPSYDRLTALDASFLGIEDRSAHMHIGSVGLFEAAPLAGPGGGIDFERVQALTSRILRDIPRYRQRVERVPMFDHPVWVDDASFNLNYHVRHTRLPAPGDERQLKRLTGRLMSQQLDRGKPLWETWFVEGLEGDRFAIVTKVHHCMVDGIGGVGLTTAAMRPDPGHDPRLDEEPPPFEPRPMPSPGQLVLAEVAHRAGGALGFAAAAAKAAATPLRAWQNVREIADGLTSGFRAVTRTPLNVAIGPHRRYDWTAMDLGLMKAVKGRLGGTVNDVVLALVAGAMRRYLGGRGVDVDHLEFRAMVPVNIRGAYDGVGNRVASVSVRLPLEEPTPRRRYLRVCAETEEAKRSHQIAAARAVEEVADWSVTTLIQQLTRLSSVAQPFNLVVTNVPGPQFPLWYLGARMVAAYPVVPVFHYQALNIALFSYDGTLYWGFNADWDAVPGLHDLVAMVDDEWTQLVEAAGLHAPAPPARASESSAQTG